MHAHDLDPGAAVSPHLSVNREVVGGDPGLLQAVSRNHTDALKPSALLNLQRLAGNSSVSSLLADEVEDQSPVHDVVTSGGGSPLAGEVRHDMEARLGHDFTDVRIHTGPRADESARAINAQAYTVGSNVVFQAGKFAPDTSTGMHTLAHELTHVVQQRSGPVAGAPVPGGIRLSDPSDPFEQAAERTADTALAPSSLPATGEASVQRAGDEEEEDETAQPLIAQRAEEEEDDEQAGAP